MNFFESMLSEDGKISHKRWLSFMIGFVVAYVSIYGAIKYEDKILDILHSDLIFILLMSGVATVSQVLSIWKGTPQNAQSPANTPKTTDDGTDPNGPHGTGPGGNP